MRAGCDVVPILMGVLSADFLPRFPFPRAFVRLDLVSGIFCSVLNSSSSFCVGFAEDLVLELDRRDLIVEVLLLAEVRRRLSLEEDKDRPPRLLSTDSVDGRDSKETPSFSCLADIGVFKFLNSGEAGFRIGDNSNSSRSFLEELSFEDVLATD